jgi:hypothetical protein
VNAATQYAGGEIELEFIREFAVAGDNIGTCLSSEDRRERIRVAIFAARLNDKVFRDTDMTYAQAYRRCYGRDIELRRFSRDSIPSHRG